MPLRLAEHRTAMQDARADFKKQKDQTCDAELASLTAAMSEDQQRAVQRAVKHKTGAWLTVMPTARNGNQLSANEWRDGIAFRYGCEPRGVQTCCDGCGEQFDADHALKCRKGGLIIRRHNDVVGELQRLAEMHWPKTVLEPVIRDGNPSLAEGHPERDGLVGDLLIRGGVYSSQTDAIIDVQVIYLNTASRLRRGQGSGGSGGCRARRRRPEAGGIEGGQAGAPDVAAPSATTSKAPATLGATVEAAVATEDGTGEGNESGQRVGSARVASSELPQACPQLLETADHAAVVLRTQEKGKELKHKSACEATRRDFVPFIVSTDGCLGEAAKALLKRLSRRLAEKWQRAYSQVVGFVKARMSVAILRASSQCMRGPRTRVQGAVCMMEDGAALDVARL